MERTLTLDASLKYFFNIFFYFLTEKIMHEARSPSLIAIELDKKLELAAQIFAEAQKCIEKRKRRKEEKRTAE